MHLSAHQVSSFHTKILDWYAENKRDFPWRTIATDIPLSQRAYCVFISEVMSQQTQITRVLQKYALWLEAFPTVRDLAQAHTSEVLGLWSGLGYNRRALNMKRAAEVIVSEYSGIFPQTEKSLLALPGIGPYTARAILCFAFNAQIAVVDTNVRKVILVEFPEINDTPSDIQSAAEQLLPHGRASEWNQALMDYSSAVLKEEKIPIPKQSKFIGSRRYYRGQVLKQLLEKKRIALSDIGLFIKKEYSGADELWLQKLLAELQTEGFIVIEGEILSLSS